MRFCGSCGAPLAAAGLAAAAGCPWCRAGNRRDEVAAGERRPLTVVFCDLVDSTRLASALDPEDLRRVLLAFREACVDAVERCGGTIGQYLGDAVLAYFGSPRAREDDPHRAVRAGLGAIAALPALNERLAAEGLLPGPLEIRVGVHTGLVVVADLGRGPHAERAAVVGETTSVAARLQQAAAPGQVLVSDATRSLVEGAFRFAEAGVHALKGVERPVCAHAALAELPPGARLAARGGPDAPFLGREAELRGLFAAWRDAAAGAGSVLVVEGEAGIGKSRLVREFRTRVGAEEREAVAMACAEDDRSSAFQPILAWLRGRLGLVPGAPAEEARHALLALVAASRLPEAEARAPLAALLGCASVEEASELAALHRRRRRRTIQALVSLVLAERRGDHPLLVLVEDVHWADDSTLTFLRTLADRCAAGGVRAMLLVTARPGRGPALPGRAPLTLRLERLSQADARRLVEAVAPAGFAPVLVERIVARTDGVPLFVEEVARAAAAAPGAGGDIPMTLRGSLMARLDALGEAKPVAQLAAVLGRSFRLDVMEAVSGEAEPASLRRSLRQLVEARFLELEGPLEEPGGYAFRHALIRDAAYESLLREQRRARHLRVAAVLRERFPEMVAARPELLAQHLAAAGRDAEAVNAYEAAARHAAAQTAHIEAAEHCRAALALLARMPEARRRAEAEVRLNVSLAAQLTIARGNAEPEVLQAFERAHAAAERLGDPRLLFRTLRGLVPYHLVRGDVAAGHTISRRLVRMVAEETDPAVLIQAHRAHGLTLLYLGRFGAARRELRRVLELYDPARHAAQRFEYGSDPAVLARCHLGWVEWFLGHPDRAEAESEASVTAARALDHPHSLAFALSFRACLGQFSGRSSVAWAAAAEVARIARALDYAYWAAWSEILQGWALAREGEVAAGEHLLRQGLRDYTDTGAGLLRPYALYLLAAVIGEERRREAVTLLDQGLLETEAHSILFWQAEMLRLKGELLATSDPVDATDTLQRAVAVAKAQGAVDAARRATALLETLCGQAEPRSPRGTE